MPHKKQFKSLQPWDQYENLPIEEKIEFARRLAAHDPANSALFAATRIQTRLSPERRLQFAILAEALCDIDRFIVRGKKFRHNAKDAYGWTRSIDRRWLYSFENCCEGVGLSPNYVRGLIDRKLGDTGLAQLYGVRCANSGTPYYRAGRYMRGQGFVRLKAVN